MFHWQLLPSPHVGDCHHHLSHWQLPWPQACSGKSIRTFTHLYSPARKSICTTPFRLWMTLIATFSTTIMVWHDKVSNIFFTANLTQLTMPMPMSMPNWPHGVNGWPCNVNDGHAMSTDGHAMSTDGHAMSTDGHAMSTDGHAMSMDGHSVNGWQHNDNGWSHRTRPSACRLICMQAHTHACPSAYKSISTVHEFHLVTYICTLSSYFQYTKRPVVTSSQPVFWLSPKVLQLDRVWVKTLRTATMVRLQPFSVRSSCRFFAGLATGLLNTTYHPACAHSSSWAWSFLPWYRSLWISCNIPNIARKMELYPFPEKLGKDFPLPFLVNPSSTQLYWDEKYTLVLE